MKICDMVHAYTATSGGIRTYLDEKRAWLAERTSWEHVLIVPGDRDTITRHDRQTIHTIQSPLIPGCAPYRLVTNLDRVSDILASELPDVIEIGSGYTLPWAAFRHKQNHHCRIIGFYHTDYPTAYVERFIRSHLGRIASSAAKTLASRYVAAVYNRCDLTVTPSELMRKRLHRYGIGNVSVQPLGVDTRVFHPGRRSMKLRTSLGIGPDDLLLVYSGRLDIEKRPDILVEALQLVPKELRAHLLLIGDGPMKQDLFRGALAENLHHLPYTTDKYALAELLASADMYVTAGAFETFGLSVLEAQASGLPVVGVRAGALIERVDHETGRLVRPATPVEMARAIADIALNGSKKIGAAARGMVEENYSWDRTFQRLAATYEAITVPRLSA